MSGVLLLAPLACVASAALADHQARRGHFLRVGACAGLALQSLILYGAAFVGAMLP